MEIGPQLVPNTNHRHWGRPLPRERDCLFSGESNDAMIWVADVFMPGKVELKGLKPVSNRRSGFRTSLWPCRQNQQRKRCSDHC